MNRMAIAYNPSPLYSSIYPGGYNAVAFAFPDIAEHEPSSVTASHREMFVLGFQDGEDVLTHGRSKRLGTEDSWRGRGESKVQGDTPRLLMAVTRVVNVSAAE